MRSHASLTWERDEREPRRVCRFRTWFSGWGFGTWLLFFPYIGDNHPNWLYHIFQRGRYTTNQFCQVCVEFFPWCAIKLTSWSRPWSVTLATEIPLTLSLAKEKTRSKQRKSWQWQHVKTCRQISDKQIPLFFSLRRMFFPDILGTQCNYIVRYTSPRTAVQGQWPHHDSLETPEVKQVSVATFADLCIIFLYTFSHLVGNPTNMVRPSPSYSQPIINHYTCQLRIVKLPIIHDIQWRKNAPFCISLKHFLFWFCEDKAWQNPWFRDVSRHQSIHGTGLGPVVRSPRTPGSPRWPSKPSPCVAWERPLGASKMTRPIPSWQPSTRPPSVAASHGCRGSDECACSTMHIESYIIYRIYHAVRCSMMQAMYVESYIDYIDNYLHISTYNTS